MTVDSAYYPEEYEVDADTEYPFQIESIGETAIQIWLVLEDGTRVQFAEYVQ